MNKQNNFLDGFKALFGSTQKIKLLIALVLVVFLVFFIAFGGCSNGCGCGGCSNESSSSCAGCSSCFSCSGCSDCGSGGLGSDPYAEGMHDYDGFGDAEVSYTDIVAYGDSVRVTMYYPTDRMTYTEDMAEYILDSANAKLVSDDYNIEIGATSVGSMYTSDGEPTTTFDEYCGVLLDNMYSGYSGSCERMTIGGNDAIVAYHGDGSVTISFSAANIDPAAVIEMMVIPAGYAEGELNYSDSVTLFKREDVQAILASTQLTTPDVEPEADYQFTHYVDGKVQAAGHDFVMPVTEGSGGVFTADLTAESNGCSLKLLGCERLPIDERFYEAYSKEGYILVTWQFTNNSDKACSLIDRFYTEVCNEGGSGYYFARISLDTMRNIQPGETILVQEYYFSYAVSNAVVLSTRGINDDGSVSEEYFYSETVIPSE